MSNLIPLGYCVRSVLRAGRKAFTIASALRRRNLKGLAQTKARAEEKNAEVVLIPNINAAQICRQHNHPATSGQSHHMMTIVMMMETAMTTAMAVAA